MADDDNAPKEVQFLFKAMRERASQNKRQIKPRSENFTLEFAGFGDDDDDSDYDAEKDHDSEASSNAEDDNEDGSNDSEDYDNEISSTPSSKRFLISGKEENDAGPSVGDLLCALNLTHTPPADDEPPTTTRSGRKVRLPNYLKETNFESPIKGSRQVAKEQLSSSSAESSDSEEETGSPIRMSTPNLMLICSVCLLQDSPDTTEMLQCDQCGITVHECCYGTAPLDDDTSSDDTDSPTEPWFCDCCCAGVISPDCELCPLRGGLMKQTDNDLWVHYVCGLFTPGLAYGDVMRLSDVTLSTINYTFWSAKDCSLCDDRRFCRTGISIQCDAGLCRTFFHASCAQKAGYLFKYDIYDSSDQMVNPYFAYCKQHAEKELVVGNRRNYITFKATLANFKPDLDDRIERKLKQYRQRYVSFRKKYVRAYVPELKVPRLPTSCPSLCKNLALKSEMMGVNPGAPGGEISSMSFKRWHVPLALNVDFVAYFLERQGRAKEVKERLRENISENGALKDTLKALEDKFTRISVVNEKLEDAIESEVQSMNRLTTLLSEISDRCIEIPEVFKHRINLQSRTRKTLSPTDDMHRCSICKKITDQHLLIDCDACRLYFHLGCLDPPLQRKPKRSASWKWQCSNCSLDTGTLEKVEILDKRRDRKKTAVFAPDNHSETSRKKSKSTPAANKAVKTLSPPKPHAVATPIKPKPIQIVTPTLPPPTTVMPKLTQAKHAEKVYDFIASDEDAKLPFVKIETPIKKRKKPIVSKKFSCVNCKRIFFNETSMRKHRARCKLLKRELNKTLSKKDLDKQNFKTKKILDPVHKCTAFVCSKCKNAYKRYSTLLTHSLRNHNDPAYIKRLHDARKKKKCFCTSSWKKQKKSVNNDTIKDVKTSTPEIPASKEIDKNKVVEVTDSKKTKWIQEGTDASPIKECPEINSEPIMEVSSDAETKNKKSKKPKLENKPNIDGKSSEKKDHSKKLNKIDIHLEEKDGVKLESSKKSKKFLMITEDGVIEENTLNDISSSNKENDSLNDSIPVLELDEELQSMENDYSSNENKAVDVQASSVKNSELTESSLPKMMMKKVKKVELDNALIDKLVVPKQSIKKAKKIIKVTQVQSSTYQEYKPQNFDRHTKNVQPQKKIKLTLDDYSKRNKLNSDGNIDISSNKNTRSTDAFELMQTVLNSNFKIPKKDSFAEEQPRKIKRKHPFEKDPYNITKRKAGPFHPRVQKQVDASNNEEEYDPVSSWQINRPPVVISADDPLGLQSEEVNENTTDIIKNLPSPSGDFIPPMPPCFAEEMSIEDVPPPVDFIPPPPPGASYSEADLEAFAGGLDVTQFPPPPPSAVKNENEIRKQKQLEFIKQIQAHPQYYRGDYSSKPESYHHNYDHSYEKNRDNFDGGNYHENESDPYYEAKKSMEVNPPAVYQKPFFQDQFYSHTANRNSEYHERKRENFSNNPPRRSHSFKNYPRKERNSMPFHGHMRRPPHERWRNRPPNGY